MDLPVDCRPAHIPSALCNAAGTQACMLPDTPPLLSCSVWTVDLAHLLCLCGLKVTLTTTVLGTNPAYASDAFYMENLAEDAGRVKHLFEVNHIRDVGSK